MFHLIRCALIVLVAGAGCAAKQTPAVEKQSLPAPAPAKDDMALVQGNWRVDKVEPLDESFEKMVGATFAITADTMVVTTSEKREESKFVLRPDANPKQFDIIDAKSGGVMVQGTYTLTGDMFVMKWSAGEPITIVLKRP